MPTWKQKRRKGEKEDSHETNISEDTQETDELELLLEEWRGKYTLEDEQETQEPKTTAWAENQGNAADREAQKHQEETTTKGRQKQTRRTSQPERRRESREEAEATDNQEEEQYANHEPGEPARLLEEFTEAHIAAEHDTPERTEEENRRYEDKEDMTSQRKPGQQAAEQENKARSNQEETGKEGDANAQQGKQKDDHEPDTLERLLGEWTDQDDHEGKKIKNAKLAASGKRNDKMTQGAAFEADYISIDQRRRKRRSTQEKPSPQENQTEKGSMGEPRTKKNSTKWKTRTVKTKRR